MKAVSAPLVTSNVSQENPTETFIKDLKVFVRSISRQKYQPKSYWNAIDTLWTTIQERKQNLEGQFDEDERRQIRKWEKRYHELRRKQLKHA